MQAMSHMCDLHMHIAPLKPTTHRKKPVLFKHKTWHMVLHTSTMGKGITS